LFSEKARSLLVVFNRSLKQLSASVDAAQNSCHAAIYYVAGDAATASVAAAAAAERAGLAGGLRRQIRETTLVC